MAGNPSYGGSVIFLLMAACSPPRESEEVPCADGFGRAADGNCYPLEDSAADTAADTAILPSDIDSGPLSGTIVAERAGETAIVVAAASWGYFADGKALIYVSPNPETTCLDVAEMVSGSNENWNPAAVNSAGACGVFAFGDYDGKTGTWKSQGDGIVVLTCPMDDGTWVWEKRDDAGYYYTGPYWQGSPISFALTVSGAAEDLRVGMAMAYYDGNFIYDSMEDGRASGLVSGVASVSWCEDIAGTLYFQ